MLTGHGDDIYRYPDIRYNFSSNVNPRGASPALKEHLKGCMEKIEHYPSPMAEDWVEMIAQSMALSSENVLATNGAVEAIYLIAELFAAKKSWIFYPSFSEYEGACVRFNHSVEYYHHSAFSQVDYSAADLVWFCNPNNPDGAIYDTGILSQKIEAYPNTLFVVDEAYVDFTDEVCSLVSCLPKASNLMVIKSMTKRFAIPGLRLGFLMANKNIIEALKQRVMPWRLNALAIEAGKFCLTQNADDGFNIKTLLQESQRVQNSIHRLKGFRVHWSSTTFFLVEGPVEASILKNRLAEEHGILIRDASNFRGLGDRFFRVSVRSEEENNYLIRALERWG
ncbi:threonine-phosphate decarboxylase [Thermophagus sp. OGC60D27]|uniref:threonine-phosphate decarboxylase n=1 Tax=Thermophagus sp. OGC60D27 TaxID=3458415 RepID=UPI0040383C4A